MGLGRLLAVARSSDLELKTRGIGGAGASGTGGGSAVLPLTATGRPGDRRSCRCGHSARAWHRPPAGGPAANKRCCD